jgi:hypothetical protein
VQDVCLSVPTVVGCGGARQQVELPLTSKEQTGLQNSARVLHEIIDQVEARVGKVRATAPQTSKANGSASRSGRVVPRSAWQTAR